GTILLDRAERGEEGEGICVGRDVDARDQVAGDVRANVDRGDAVLAPTVHETGQHLRPDALPAVFRAYAEADDPGVVGVAALVGEAEHDADDGAARRLFGDEALIRREVGIQQVRAAPAGGVEWIRPHHLVPGVEKAGLVAGAVGADRVLVLHLADSGRDGARDIGIGDVLQRLRAARTAHRAVRVALQLQGT